MSEVDQLAKATVDLDNPGKTSSQANESTGNVVEHGSNALPPEIRGEDAPQSTEGTVAQSAETSAPQGADAQPKEPQADTRKDSVPEIDLTQERDTPEPSHEGEHGTKRGHSEEDGPSAFEDPEYLRRLLPPPETCNAVRSKIRRFIESGEMKVGEFCSAIKVSNNAYNNFMKKNGTYNGRDCAAYCDAMAFFFRREAAGLKIPKKQKTTPKKEENGKATKDSVPDISDVHLEGEEEDAVPVHETCDDVRCHINAHLRKPNVTQAQFCRDLKARSHTSNGMSMSASMLQAFRGKKGADAGNTSPVFYAADVFFEKLRIKEGKGKGKKRLEMEEIWPNGFDREIPSNRG